MAEPYQQQSALAHLGLTSRAAADQADPERAEAGVRLGERDFRGQINLRGDPANEAFMDAVAGVIGCRLPTEPNTSAGDDDLRNGPRVLWLGPDEWFLVTLPGGEVEIVEALAGPLAGSGGSLTDVSDVRAVISISGRHARDVLMKGCPLDLHPAVFEPGHCAQSLLARASVILTRRTDEAAAGGSSFDIYVARSFADYLWTWLEDAAGEYGVRVIEG